MSESEESKRANGTSEFGRCLTVADGPDFEPEETMIVDMNGREVGVDVTFLPPEKAVVEAERQLVVVLMDQVAHLDRENISLRRYNRNARVSLRQLQRSHGFWKRLAETRLERNEELAREVERLRADLMKALGSVGGE